MMVGLTKKVQGLVRARVVRNGKTWFDSGLNNNMLLDNFFSRASSDGTDGTLALTSYCYVRAGSGATAPQATDTALESPLTGFLSADSYNADFAKTYDSVAGTVTGTETWTYTLAEGAVVGNVSELGFLLLRDNSSNTTLDVRTLLKDSSGDPTTITLTSADQLILEHSVAITIPEYSESIIDVDGVSTTVGIHLTNQSSSGSNNIFKSIYHSNRNYKCFGQGSTYYGFSSYTFDAADKLRNISTLSGGQYWNAYRTVTALPRGASGEARAKWEIGASAPEVAGGVAAFRLIADYNSGSSYEFGVLTFDPPLPKGSKKLELVLTDHFQRI